MHVKRTALGTAVLVTLLCGFQVSAETVGTAGVPTGFGLAGGALGVSLSGSYGEPRNPPTDNTRFDASGAVMAGFGNPVDGLGFQAGVSITSFRNFGKSGSLTLGVHKMFQTSEAGLYSVALNATNLAPWGDAEQLDAGASLVGSYLTSMGGKLALISLGAANDTNAARDVEGIFGFGIGLTDDVGVSIGQAGSRTAVGMSFATNVIAGNSLNISVSHDADTDDNTLVFDLSRTFNLFGN